eukprot:TRINITY_DN20786_c0_g1_i1.p2 TRINITY_DN20786_c0_g1~~TRINITY_DN20786_c0_g1_i1.p2  ORF type:complete len:385 (-),score=35.31 TRINITY_DN20786_c0_g1_i1:1445-2599(-)
MLNFKNADIFSLMDNHYTYDLGESTVISTTVNSIFNANEKLQETINEMKLGYGTSSGDKELRIHLAKDLQKGSAQEITPEDVMTTVGAQMGLFLTATSIVGEGTEVIVPTPTFTPAINIFEGLKGTVKNIPLTHDDKFQLSVDMLKQHLTPATKLVYIISPGNPTGVTTKPEVLQGLAEEMKKVGGYLLVDETYRDAMYAGWEAIGPSAVTLPVDNIIVTSSFSKALGAPGIRLGVLSTRNAELMQKFITLKNLSYICNGVLDETIALEVMKHKEAQLTPQLEWMKVSIAKVKSFVEQNADFVEWVEPDGGAICCVRLKVAKFPTDTDVDKFHSTLHTKFDTFVTPGKWFTAEYRTFRLGFTADPERLSPALENVGKALRETAV